MAREDFARFQRSCHRAFSKHTTGNTPATMGSGFSSIDHLVRSGKAPGFESEIDSRKGRAATGHPDRAAFVPHRNRPDAARADEVMFLRRQTVACS
jgi:hypothetical protein